MQTAADRTTPLPSALVHDAAVLLRSHSAADRLKAMQMLAKGYAEHEEERLSQLVLPTQRGGLVH